MATRARKASLTTEVMVQNPHGLHLRFAGKLVALTSTFASTIVLTKGRHQANAKSILDLISLSAAPGTNLGLQISGDDASAALAAVSDFFQHYTCEP